MKGEEIRKRGGEGEKIRGDGKVEGRGKSLSEAETP